MKAEVITFSKTHPCGAAARGEVLQIDAGALLARSCSPSKANSTALGAWLLHARPWVSSVASPRALYLSSAEPSSSSAAAAAAFSTAFFSISASCSCLAWYTPGVRVSEASWADVNSGSRSGSRSGSCSGARSARARDQLGLALAFALLDSVP